MSFSMMKNSVVVLSLGQFFEALFQDGMDFGGFDTR
jgi:hypothetical protein